MTPKYDSPVSKEDFINLLKYSLPLAENKEEQQQGKESREISDLVNDELRERSNVEDKNKPPNPANTGGIYNSTILLYPDYSLTGAYLDRRIEAMHDFSDRVPGKHLHTFPISGNEGLYGFTFLGDVHAWRREDLFGDLAKMVDIHECIHTPNEYETRRITDAIMSKERPKYIK